MSADLTTVIEDAVSDAAIESSTSDSLSVDSSSSGESLSSPDPAPMEPTGSGEPSVDLQTNPTSSEVSSPAAQAAKGLPVEEVDKKLGIPSHTNGRENRIPYSRVKKIVENAEKAAITPLQTKVTEYEGKLKAYEAGFNRVAQFEHTMLNEQPKFLQMLSQIPAYQPFFRAVQELQSQAQKQAQTQPQVVDNDPMPQPDADGTYTMDGLKGLLDWQARQVRAQVQTEVDTKYGPIQQQYEAQQNLQRAMPRVEAQIRRARTWPKFNENEQEITNFLARYPTAKLEDAYMNVVLPKLQADVESAKASATVNMAEARKKLLAELKQAPASTSAPGRSVRPSPVAPTGKQSLEDVIGRSLKEAGLS
jgi:hypothetical protein